MPKPVTCARKTFLSHLIGSQLQRKFGCLAQYLKIHNPVIEMQEAPQVSSIMTPLLEEIQPCVSVAMGVATLLAKAVETLLRVTENRVMPAKEEREKGKEWQIDDQFYIQLLTY